MRDRVARQLEELSDAGTTSYWSGSYKKIDVMVVSHFKVLQDPLLKPPQRRCRSILDHEVAADIGGETRRPVARTPIDADHLTPLRSPTCLSRAVLPRPCPTLASLIESPCRFHVLRQSDHVKNRTTPWTPEDFPQPTDKPNKSNTTSSLRTIL